MASKFYVQDKGVYIPTDGLAQSFSVLNFEPGNSLGVGTETVTPTVNPDNPNFISNILQQDLWGYNDQEDLYRISSVGVGTDVVYGQFNVGQETGDAFVVDDVGNIGIGLSQPTFKLEVSGNAKVQAEAEIGSTLDVTGATTLNNTLDVTSATTLNDTLDVTGATAITNTLNVTQDTTLGANLSVQGQATVGDTLSVTSSTTLGDTLTVTSGTTLNDTLDVTGATTLNDTLDVSGDVTVTSTTGSVDKDTGSIVTEGGVGIEENLNVGNDAKIGGVLELESFLRDVNDYTADDKKDWRLSAVGTGVSWRPSGVETQNTIWVTKDGNDNNTGLLEGDAKATIGAAAEAAQEGDTIIIKPGIYLENNPIGLRTDVSVTGEDIRLVTVTPQNVNLDVFHVRRGCLIENLNFAGTSVGVNHSGCGAVAFPPTVLSERANTGYIADGPALEGPTGRWRSPYIRNCTNFMTGSIGMRINGDHASVSDPINNIGNNLKSMVCDSFTQYNENGIGVSITNNGYAQLVSIFTIASDIGIYCDTGGSCDLTNSNSSFGNFGLYAVGLGITEYSGVVDRYPPTKTSPGVLANSDVVAFNSVYDVFNNVRRPYDGQAIFFKIDLTNYGDVDQTYVAGLPSNILTEPMLQVQEIRVTNGGSGFSPLAPPTVIVRDADDFTQDPKGPQGIIAELSPTIDEVTGSITAIDVVNSGRNYLPSQNLEVFIDGGGATAELITQPIYYTVDVATEVTPVSGISTVTFNQFIPYELFGGEEVSFKRISRILTSSHSFEYIGTGVDINNSTPFQGAVPIKENEIVALDGAQIPFTSTDQKGNFDIGEGFQINQPTATIRGRDFSKAIQAEVTPLILALR